VVMFGNGFPGAVVHEPESSSDRVNAIVDEITTRYADGKLTKADMEQYAAELDLLLTDYSTRGKHTSGTIQINRVLKHVGLSYDRKSHHPKSPNYEVYVLRKLKSADNIAV